MKTFQYRFFWHLLFATAMFSNLGNAAIVTNDTLGRVSKVEYPDGTVIEYPYDTNGNPLNRKVIKPIDLTVTTTPTDGGLVAGAGRFYRGSNSSLLATPATDHLFVAWETPSGTVLSSDPAYTHPITGAETLIARFRKLTSSEVWRQVHFGNSANAGSGADTADPDGDGLKNLSELGFGLDPNISQTGVITVTGGQISKRGTPTTSQASTPGGIDFRAVFGRRKDYIAAGLTYTVQFSGDLTNWVSSTTPPTILADDGEIQAVSVRYPFFAGTKKARFFRVQITTTP